jgi:hypothetical protein
MLEASGTCCQVRKKKVLGGPLKASRTIPRWSWNGRKPSPGEETKILYGCLEGREKPIIPTV